MLCARNCLLVYETLSIVINNFTFAHFILVSHTVATQLIKVLAFSNKYQNKIQKLKNLKKKNLFVVTSNNILFILSIKIY